MITANPYFEKTIKSARTFLARWHGADALMWELTVSIKSLIIVLSRPGEKGNLVIGCVDPITIRGPVRWRNCHLEVMTTALSEEGKAEFIVTDPSVNFEVLCGKIEVKENVKLW
jgi:hypothetical protein